MPYGDGKKREEELSIIRGGSIAALGKPYVSSGILRAPRHIREGGWGGGKLSVFAEGVGADDDRDDDSNDDER